MAEVACFNHQGFVVWDRVLGGEKTLEVHLCEP